MPLDAPVRDPQGQRALYETEVRRRILNLYEDLVRHDENIAAWKLLDECVPYFLRADPAIATARDRQRRNILHILDPDAYRRYYGDNPREAPFEEMYGVPPERAHEVLPRVAILRNWLSAQAIERGQVHSKFRVLDLACNDGMLAVNLFEWCGMAVDGVDLNESCIARANDRKARHGLTGDFHIGRAEAAGIAIAGVGTDEDGCYDAVVAFELIEHVADPAVLLRVMAEVCKPDGRLYVSTPLGAVEQGVLTGAMDWKTVEPKGHVRSWSERDFRTALSEVGTIEDLVTGPDNVMVACVKLAAAAAG